MVLKKNRNNLSKNKNKNIFVINNFTATINTRCFCFFVVFFSLFFMDSSHFLSKNFEYTILFYTPIRSFDFSCDNKNTLKDTLFHLIN